MYEVSTRKASATEAGCRQKNIPAAIGTENHLWASHVIESAASMPARCPRRLGERIAAPPHAASTWNQSPWERQKRASSDKGSIAPARGPGCADHHAWRETVPAVFGDAPTEIAEVHPQSAVRCHRPDRAASEPGHVGDLA